MTIKDIQRQFEILKIDAYIVSYGNRFIGQDILPQEHKLQILCGFSGSDGALIVFKDKVFLLVDGRYELQAQKEVNQNIIEIVNKTPVMSNICETLYENAAYKVGYDAWCHSVYDIAKTTENYNKLEFINVGNLVETETHYQTEIFHRAEKYSGQSKDDKCRIVADFIKDNQADYFLFCAADSVSWLLNIYAHDLPYSPVVRAFALADNRGNVKLFGENLQADFPTYGWEDFQKTLGKLKDKKVLYDPQMTPQIIKQLIPSTTKMVEKADICRILKMQKNPTELAGMINSHVRDGVALTKLLYWLDCEAHNVTELDVVRKLHELRMMQVDYVSESFATIAGFAQNGAIVHYKPNKISNKLLCKGNLFLLDSGAQYLDGTTDVTRTIAIGQPNRQMISDFTHVLKAHIALAKAIFPVGTVGKELDVLARSKLQATGIDYKHGTGHGVACFGNVHEGPIGISPNISSLGFRKNMVVSNEPGVYRSGEYGIRIENLQYSVPCEDEEYLCFKILTKVPIDKKLIDVYLLDDEEKTWINNYHQDVYLSLVDFLSAEEGKWLSVACSPL